MAVLWPAAALAIQDRADVERNEAPAQDSRFAWKATFSRYFDRDTGPSTDTNLRANDDDQTAWIGFYRAGGAFQQTRAGYERQFRFALGRVIASAQVASGGFLGGSVTWAASLHESDRVYGLVGIGRTNQRTYMNLNFDPNDSTLLGVGWRPDDATLLSIYQVRDDRLGTGQRVTHAVLVRTLDDAWRLGVDLFRRQGGADADAPRIRAGGFGVTLDHRGWFVRLARDPGWAFTDSTMTRVSIGVRF